MPALEPAGTFPGFGGSLGDARYRLVTRASPHAVTAFVRLKREACVIECRFFGTVQLTGSDGREVTSLLTRPRRLALFAYLAAASPAGFHRRDTLLALFWPELDQDHARAALRQALHVLRDSLGAGVVLTRGDEEIGLDFARVRCDVVTFNAAVASGQLQDAMELYRGHLLQGFFDPGASEFEDWLERERARLQQVAAQCARTLVERCATAGELENAVGWSRVALGLAPHDEGSVRRLMTLLDQRGDRAGAVAAYESFAKQLADDLETEPAAETKALLSAVRAREQARPVTLSIEAPDVLTAAGAVSGRTASRRLLWGSLAAVAVIAVLIAVTIGDWRPLVRAQPVTRIQSLAVLPLANLSGDTLQAPFAEGLTQALITDLGRTVGIPVILVDSVFPFRTTSKPLRDIVKELHVDALLEGGVRRSGTMVRVEVRLLDARTGFQLWADRFEQSANDPFVLEDSVTRGIIAGLKLASPTAVAQRPLTPPTQNPQAYDLYLRGKIRALHENRADDSIAIELLEQAVALDPSFAAAYAQLAHAYGLRATRFTPGDLDVRDRAAVAAEKALRLNPDLAEGHYARAFLLWGPGRRFPHELAIQEARLAVSLDPGLPKAHHHLGLVYLHIGLLDSAIAEFRKTLALDPSEGFAQQRIGIALVYQGRYADGLRTFREVPPEFDPSLWHYQVAWALLYLGRDDEALTLIDDYLRQHPEDPGGVVTAARAILFAKRAEAQKAEADIQAALTKGVGFQHFHHASYSIAMAYALLNRPESAVRFLRQAAAEGMPCYPCFANDPYLARIRNDSGFTSFMRELKDQSQRYQAIASTPTATAQSR